MSGGGAGATVGALDTEGAALAVPAGRDASGGDPADLVASCEAVREAFVVALQRLPSRQRAVLILRDVLRWHADEVAELLGCTRASVNSALQRARATLAAGHPASPGEPDDDRQRALLAGYVQAFERSDVDALVSLLRLDHLGPDGVDLGRTAGSVDADGWLPTDPVTRNRAVPAAANSRQ